VICSSSKFSSFENLFGCTSLISSVQGDSLICGADFVGNMMD